jgi:phosphate transport system substrate-binding protein
MRQPKGLILPAVILVGLGWILTLRSHRRPSQTGDPQATVKVSGAWALYPLVVRWAEEFQQQHPEVRVDVSAGGAGKGVTDALTGLVDIGMVSRQIAAEEVKRGGIGVPVAQDVVLAVVNAQNPVRSKLLSQGLKRQTLLELWITGQITTWGQVVGSPDRQQVHVYTRSDACGAAETWAQYLGQKQERLRGVAVYSDPGLAEAIRRDALGIGYCSLNYAFDMKTGRPLSGLQVVPLDVDGDGILEPGEKVHGSRQAVLAAVKAGRYPTPPARYLHFLTRGQPRGAVREFILWTLREGQQYAADVGYIPLPAAKVREALQKLR